jgi:dTDP-4-dehydrorhamnose reductase
LNNLNAMAHGLQLWGGLECTVNRVGNRRFDQIGRSRHDERLSDLDLFASLGIQAIRYPVIWERVAPNGVANADWSTTDLQLNRLRDLNVEPIVGLVHHGSGPYSTDLLDPEFPDKLAEYALAVAKRYPWLTTYCPLNEPLTTARFSGLYGHWHPHGMGERTFVDSLLNQCRAINMAMSAIRTISPNATLVMTEDVGRVFSTQTLSYQAEFENERRWCSLDLLCGRVVPGNRMHAHFSWVGISEVQLRWFAENPCPPDLIGIDYYPSSERFLDEDWSKYPASARGGNGRHEYADVDAVRVRPEGIAGQEAVLSETWQRYKIPVALTECHIACAVDEQIAWFNECWNAALQARLNGVPVAALTVWSLLGAFDWDSLCTFNRGHYEPGPFDISSGEPVATDLATAIREIALGRPFGSLVEGWWKRPERLLYRQPVPSHSQTIRAKKAECLV